MTRHSSPSHLPNALGFELFPGLGLLKVSNRALSFGEKTTATSVVASLFPEKCPAISFAQPLSNRSPSGASLPRERHLPGPVIHPIRLRKCGRGSCGVSPCSWGLIHYCEVDLSILSIARATNHGEIYSVQLVALSTCMFKGWVGLTVPLQE